MSHSGISKCQLPRLPHHLSSLNGAFEIIAKLKKKKKDYIEMNVFFYFFSRGKSKRRIQHTLQMNCLSLSSYVFEKIVIDVFWPRKDEM